MANRNITKNVKNIVAVHLCHTPATSALVSGPPRHKTQSVVGGINPFIGDGKMLTAQPMLQAAMTVALLSVCVCVC